jgi:hypothetical protein
MFLVVGFGQIGFFLDFFFVPVPIRVASGASPSDTTTGDQTRTNRCPGIRRTSRLSSSTLSVAITWPAVMPVRAIKSSTAVG